MRRILSFFAACLLLGGGQAVLAAQEPGPPAVDSIVVQGNQRLTPSQIVGSSGIIVHQPINYRDIQRAITALFQTGQFDDVLVEQRNEGQHLLLVLRVKERPVLEKGTVRGVNRVGEGGWGGGGGRGEGEFSPPGGPPAGEEGGGKAAPRHCFPL